MKSLLLLCLLPLRHRPLPGSASATRGSSRGGSCQSGVGTTRVLQASDILRPNGSQGRITKYARGGSDLCRADWLVIDSDAGTFEAAGNVLLQQRIAEINAILQLRHALFASNNHTFCNGRISAFN